MHAVGQQNRILKTGNDDYLQELSILEHTITVFNT